MTLHEEIGSMDIGSWGDPRSGGWWWRADRHRRRGMRRFRRGVLKLALLKLLADVPRHGYDLIRAIREKGWGGGAGSVYPILAALEAAGLVVGREEGERRIYEITEKGRGLLGERAAELERFLNEDDDDEGDAAVGVADRLRTSAARLMQSVAQLGPSSKPETIDRVCEFLDEARKEIYQLLAEE
jgi:DNA-binding PadR family transcriptional regulator